MEALLRAGVGPRALEQARGRSHLALARAAAGLACGRAAAALAVGGGAAVWTWPGAPFNQALGLGWSGAPPAPELDAVEAFFRARDEACAIDLADQAHGAWKDLLRDRGYRLRESLYLWVRPLEDGDRRAMDPRVAPVTNAAERKAWANAVAGGFADGAALGARDLDVARAVCAAPAAELFLARDATGAPVAGGALQVDGAVASLYSASTLPSARRQGLQRALIEARLARARACGARVAAIHTDPTGGSRRNVERLGFRVAYTCWSLIAPPAGAGRRPPAAGSGTGP